MVWMMFGVIGIPIKKTLGLNATEFGLLTAMPVLTGSLIRVPLGIWTDRYGGRIVMTLLMALTVPAIWLMAYATRTGTSWSSACSWAWRAARSRSARPMWRAGSPRTARVGHGRVWRRQLGRGGQQVRRARAGGGLWLDHGAAGVCRHHAGHRHPVLVLQLQRPGPPGAAQHEVQRPAQDAQGPAVLKYCQYYSIVFGGYVALSLWMVQYYVGEYGLDIRAAALLAACFSLPGGVLRAVGGWLSDKYGAHSVTWWVMWVSWICLFLLSYPQTDFTVLTVDGPKTFHIGLNVYTFTILMFVLGIAMAFGKASVFKYISDDFPTNIGTVSGIVGLAGGLGGFVLPIMFGALMDLTGIRSSAFMLMYGVVWVSLIWMYWTEVRRTEVMGFSLQG
jgi:NNP family nitrate/nitrite transporter-like MFS transporter